MLSKNLQPVSSYRVTLFLIVLGGLTTAALLLAERMPGSPLTSLIMMWTPALAAILVSVITKRRLHEIGWALRPVKWLAVGWLLPISYAALAYVPLWITGLGSVPNPTFLERARLTLNMPDSSDISVIIAALGFITAVNLLPGLVMSIGEEIGWRGFLLPELAKSVSVGRAGLYSGIIWGVWHLPAILSGEYGASDTYMAFRIMCFAVLVISGGVIFAWLRIKSGSIWPVAILHAVHNNAIQAFFDRITGDTGYTAYFSGEFGLALALVNLLFAVACWRQLVKTNMQENEHAIVATLSRT